MERQLELLRGGREGLRRVPELSDAMRLTLTAVELCAGAPLWQRRFRRPGREGYIVSPRALKRCIREGLVEVVSLAPAVYRVTRLGAIARKLRR